MSWLMRDGQVLASLEIAVSWRERMIGLLGRDRFDGALLLRPARSVHTLGMRFPIDVAFCDEGLVVLRTITMAPNRVSRPVRRGRAVIEVAAGAFDEWGLGVGDRLEVKG